MLTNKSYVNKRVSIRPWLALGMAWLKQNTHELLPWLELLPSPYYLPLLWKDRPKRNYFELLNTQALRTINTLETEFQSVEPYLKILNLTMQQVL